jgi:hypothetical protein
LKDAAQKAAQRAQRQAYDQKPYPAANHSNVSFYFHICICPFYIEFSKQSLHHLNLADWFCIAVTTFLLSVHHENVVTTSVVRLKSD